MWLACDFWFGNDWNQVFMWHDCLLTMMTSQPTHIQPIYKHCYLDPDNVWSVAITWDSDNLVQWTWRTSCLSVIANRAMETLLNKSSGNNIHLVAIVALCDIYLWLQTEPWRQSWATLMPTTQLKLPLVHYVIAICDCKQSHGDTPSTWSDASVVFQMHVQWEPCRDI